MASAWPDISMHVKGSWWWRWIGRTGRCVAGWGKSDPIDAEAAARAALSGDRQGDAEAP